MMQISTADSMQRCASPAADITCCLPTRCLAAAASLWCWDRGREARKGSEASCSPADARASSHVETTGMSVFQTDESSLVVAALGDVAPGRKTPEHRGRREVQSSRRCSQSASTIQSGLPLAGLAVCKWIEVPRCRTQLAKHRGACSVASSCSVASAQPCAAFSLLLANDTDAKWSALHGSSKSSNVTDAWYKQAASRKPWSARRSSFSGLRDPTKSVPRAATASSRATADKFTP